MIFADKHSARDKRLLRLERELQRLRRAQWHAPIVPLERPYQNGWVKSFRLREDAGHHPERVVFAVLLKAVNHRIISRRRDFLDRAGNPMVLRPRVLTAWEWRKLAWPARYQRLFAHGNWADESVHGWKRRLWRYRKMGYKLMSTWWLEEQVQPHFITHQRVELPEVRSRVAVIERWLGGDGYGRLDNLHGLRRRHWCDPVKAGHLRAEVTLKESSSQPD